MLPMSDLGKQGRIRLVRRKVDRQSRSCEPSRRRCSTCRRCRAARDGQAERNRRQIQRRSHASEVKVAFGSNRLGFGVDTQAHHQSSCHDDHCPYSTNHHLTSPLHSFISARAVHFLFTASLFHSFTSSLFHFFTLSLFHSFTFSLHHRSTSPSTISTLPKISTTSATS